jgi:hypothetical protein
MKLKYFILPAMLLLIGGGCQKVSPESVEVSLEPNIVQSETSQLSLENTQLKSELFAARVELAIHRAHGVETFKDDTNPMRYYFITESGNMGDTQNIWLYDATRDVQYQQTGSVDAVLGAKMIYSEKIKSSYAFGSEFRGADVIGGDFIFFESGVDNSPGPCWQMWKSEKFFAISGTNLNKRSFVVPEKMRKDAQIAEDKCVREI